MWPESAGFQTHAEKPGVPTVMLRVSVLQQCGLFNFFVQTLVKNVADDLHARRSLWRICNTDHTLTLIFARHMRCSANFDRSMSRLFYKGPDV